MFDDLLDILKEQGYEDFAFADDLAINGKGYDKLIKAIEICEGWTR